MKLNTEIDSGYVDTDRIIVREAPTHLTKPLIKENHYTHSYPNTRYDLGVFYISDDDHPFFDKKKEVLVGAITFSHPVGRRVISSISPLLSNGEVLELTRLYIHDGYGKNIESYVIGQSFQWLKIHDPKVDCIISYADPGVGHMGTIYQATNFLYQGNEMQQIQSYSFKFEKDGEWLHQRTVVEQYGSTNVDHLKKTVGNTFWMREDKNKHRYLYFLCNKRRKKRLINSLKHPILDYPSAETLEKPKIHKIEV